MFLSTSSAWGVMEASIRNLVDRGVLCCMCGAFSDKWFDVAERCGKEAAPLQVDWGKHIDQKAIDRAIGHGKIRHRHSRPQRDFNRRDESAPGNLLHALAKYPDVALVLDTVSSFSGVKIDMDALGIDVMLTRRPKGAGVATRFSLFSASRKHLLAQKKSRTAVLLRFPRVQEATSRMDDAEHAKHWAHARAAIEAG